MLLLRLLAFPVVAVLLVPLILLNALSLALVDVLWLLFGRRPPSEAELPPHADFDSVAGSNSAPRSISVVIPSWNARDLLEKYLPSVVRAASFHADNEVIVVDNASEDDSSDFVRQAFPSVRVVQLDRNRGFGGGNNAGVAAARNPVVVILNNDMRVEPDCFQRLLDGFTDDRVFAVSAQIFFLDKGKRREETGFTEGRFEEGFFRFAHVPETVARPYPIFYAGGGSSAYDRDKFLALGGFDHIFHPFYVEDADLSYSAWKRGWKVLYQPAAVVHHEHRGTIGKRFSSSFIDSVVKKNQVLMVWKSVHDWGWLAQHFAFLWAGAVVSTVFASPSATRVTVSGYARALLSWPRAVARRWHARNLSRISDREASRRPWPAWFRDRFEVPSLPDSGRPLRILFLAPYSIYPPVHGGGVFMYQTVKGLAQRHEVHVLGFVDRPEEIESNQALAGGAASAASVEFVVRDFPPRRDLFGLLPYSVRCFISPEFQRRVQQVIRDRDIDVVQVEYTHMGQFAGGLHHTPTALFEHDVYFQAVRRALGKSRSLGETVSGVMEWLRALRYELRLLRRMDLVQTCSDTERVLLQSFLGDDAGHVRGDLRTMLDLREYEPVFVGRERDSVLFVGNFIHRPNLLGLRFLVEQVLPALRHRRPQTELVVAGAYPNDEVHALAQRPGVRLLGMVPDIRPALARCTVFACPIFTGSGVRVKLLEAFACGIPVVSTPLGAEGLDVEDGRDVLLARDAASFISAIIDLLENPAHAETLAREARHTLEERYSAGVVLDRLEAAYRDLLAQRRAPAGQPPLVAVSPRFS